MTLEEQMHDMARNLISVLDSGEAEVTVRKHQMHIILWALGVAEGVMHKKKPPILATPPSTDTGVIPTEGT